MKKTYLLGNLLFILVLPLSLVACDDQKDSDDLQKTEEPANDGEDDGDTGWTDDYKNNHVLTSGRIVAMDDAVDATKFTWNPAMGVSYGSKFFYVTQSNDRHNRYYIPFMDTGCGKYSETDFDRGDWRLPTLAELQEIYNNRKNIPNIISDYYWSSTESASNDGYASYVNMEDGSIKEGDKSNWYVVTNRRARCVRDLPEKESDNTSPDGNIISGKIIIALADIGGEMSWADAMGVANEYNKKGFYSTYSDDPHNSKYEPYIKTGCGFYSEPGRPAGTWRLPTLSEWRENIATLEEEAGITGWYWLSSEGSMNINGVYINLDKARSSYNTYSTYDKTQNFRVRCVRDKDS